MELVLDYTTTMTRYEFQAWARGEQTQQYIRTAARLYLDAWMHLIMHEKQRQYDIADPMLWPQTALWSINAWHEMPMVIWLHAE